MLRVFAISQTLTSKVNGLNQAVRNANDGISVVQIAEGALDEVTTILQRMRDWLCRLQTIHLSSTERGYLDTEQASFADALDDVVGAAKFGSTALLVGITARCFRLEQIAAILYRSLSIPLAHLRLQCCRWKHHTKRLRLWHQTAISTIDTALGVIASDRAAGCCSKSAGVNGTKLGERCREHRCCTFTYLGYRLRS